jgi:hypothetical protein
MTVDQQEFRLSARSGLGFLDVRRAVGAVQDRSEPPGEMLAAGVDPFVDQPTEGGIPPEAGSSGDDVLARVRGCDVLDPADPSGRPGLQRRGHVAA